MQVKFADGTIGIAGQVSKEAETKFVGNNAIPKTVFNVYLGKRKDTTPIYVSCVAWRSLAEQLQSLQKGDSVLCFGKMREREYNGKMYQDLELDFGISPALIPKRNPATPQPQYENALAKTDDIPDPNEEFEDVGDNAEELPF